MGYTHLGQPLLGSSQRSADQMQLSEDGSKATLNFVNLEVQEFVRAVFDEILEESVVVDPNLDGCVTVRTTDPVTRTAALNLVRNVLQLNGATLVKTAGVYRIGSHGNGTPRGQIGENVRIVPVQRMNAVLLTTRTPQTLARAREWIERLDQSGQDGRQVRVFAIQNRRAIDLAQILGSILNG